MAYEQPLFNVTFVAAKDLSSYQFQVVNLTTGDTITAGLTSASKCSMGVLQNNPTCGMEGNVMVLGISKVKVAGACSRGQVIGINATATDYPNMVAPLTTEVQAAKNAGAKAIGRALGGATQADDIVPALINFIPSMVGSS